MKMIIGKLGEGKTQRIVELAAELSQTFRIAILTFDVSVEDLSKRMTDYLTQKGSVVRLENSVQMKFIDTPVSKDYLIAAAKNLDCDLIFIDGLTPHSFKPEMSYADMLEFVKSIESLTNKGVMLSVQRNRNSKVNGVKVIDYLED
jgi:hypothetical protein